MWESWAFENVMKVRKTLYRKIQYTHLHKISHYISGMSKIPLSPGTRPRPGHRPPRPWRWLPCTRYRRGPRHFPGVVPRLPLEMDHGWVDSNLLLPEPLQIFAAFWTLSSVLVAPFPRQQENPYQFRRTCNNQMAEVYC